MRNIKLYKYFEKEAALCSDIQLRFAHMKIESFWNQFKPVEDILEDILSPFQYFKITNFVEYA